MSTSRRLRRHALAALAGLAAWVVGSALGAPSATPHAQALPLLTVGKAHPARFFPTLHGKKPIFILALGSDARPGEPVDRERSDSIHLIGINPRKRSASILGFPRDSWVEIPGRGTTKINAAMTIGGPKLTVETVEHLTGIRIDYYVLTSFNGLKHAVQGVGGITVNVPYSIHDGAAHAFFEAGPHHMSGGQALAFARARHDVPDGDIGRSANQGRLMVAALAEFLGDFDRDPSRALTWIGAGMRNVQTDLSLDEVLRLALTATAVRPGKIKNVVVPSSVGMVGDQSVVFIQSGAQDLYANMKDDGLID